MHKLSTSVLKYAVLKVLLLGDFSTITLQTRADADYSVLNFKSSQTVLQKPSTFTAYCRVTYLMAHGISFEGAVQTDIKLFNCYITTFKIVYEN